MPALPLGRSAGLKTGDRAVLAGAGGRQRCVAVEVVARQEFAGYWEYLLDEAIFTAPAHPSWGGAGLIGAGPDGQGPGGWTAESAVRSSSSASALRRPHTHGGADAAG